MASNRAVTFMGPHRMEVQDKEYPKLEDPQGRKVEHAGDDEDLWQRPAHL
jgi:glutathione-independent formaldehyde dehydrogenase